jgi:outer membrane protein OmpA-like peptidoglycan-associated protein
VIAKSLVALGVLALLTSCTGNDEGAPTVTTPPPSVSSPAPSTPVSTPTVTPTQSPTNDPQCAPGAGRTVRELPDITVAAVVVPPITANGQTITVLEGFTIPAQVIDAGCVIQYDAPGGCLGAVRITGARIPPVTIPESVLKATGQAPEKRFAAVTVAGAAAPPTYSPQVCQAKRDGKLLAVTRKGVVRKGVSRNGAARPGGSREGGCDSQGCVPDVRVETVRIPEVRLPDVDVDPARLESRKLQGQDVDIFTGEGKTSYVAPGDVLFDTDQYVIRPDAARALQAIAVQIKKRSPNARLRVEGHTDDRGDATYGLRLSERRARAVADWLVRNGFRASLITTKGFGETAPVVPNASAANRQKNRRVVITVLGG